MCVLLIGALFLQCGTLPLLNPWHTGAISGLAPCAFADHCVKHAWTWSWYKHRCICVDMLQRIQLVVTPTSDATVATRLEPHFTVFRKQVQSIRLAAHVAQPPAWSWSLQ